MTCSFYCSEMSNNSHQQGYIATVNFICWKDRFTFK